MAVDYESILSSSGFAFSGTCQCGGSLGRIYVRGEYEVKVWPNRNPPNFKITKDMQRGQRLALAAGSVEALKQSINIHVR